MDIQITKQNESVTVSLSGELVGAECNEFRDAVHRNVTLETGTVYVDLSNVTFIDSLGLGSLVGIKVTCSRNGARIILISPSPAAMRLLAAVKFDLVFDIREEIPA